MNNNNYTTERNDRKNQPITVSSMNKNYLQVQSTQKTRSDLEKTKSLSLLKTAKTAKTQNTTKIPEKKSEKIKIQNSEDQGDEGEENIFSLGKAKNDNELKNEYNQLKSYMSCNNVEKTEITIKI